MPRLSAEFARLFEGKRLVIFDIDGTLVDSIANWDRVVDVFAAKYGIPLTPSKLYETTSDGTILSAAKRVVAEYALNLTGQEMMDELGAIYFDEMFKPSDFFPGAREFLLALRAAGIKFAAATSGNLMNYRVFDDAITPDYFISSERLGAGKPNPLVFFNAMYAFDAKPSECLIFEDSVNGLKAARSSGATAVCFLSSQERADDKKTLADFTISSWAQMLE